MERVLLLCFGQWVYFVASFGCLDRIPESGPMTLQLSEDQLTMYCLNDDRTGGGWTLIARTGRGDVTNFGWTYSASTWDSPPYSLGIARYLSDDLVAYEFLAVGGTNSVDAEGIYSQNTSVWHILMDANTSIHELTNYARATHLTSIWDQTPSSQCNSTPAMLEWMGWTNLNGNFFSRDNPDTWPTGLQPFYWSVFYSGCTGGYLDGKHGTLWARIISLPSETVQSDAKMSPLSIGLSVAVGLLGLIVIALVIFILLRKRSRETGPPINPTQLNRLSHDSIIRPSTTRDGREKSILLLSDVIMKEKIGQGQFGNVFRGTWAKIEVALKGIQKEESNLQKEAQLLQELNHPNIVRFFGLYFSHKEQKTYMVMEYMNDGSLDNFVKASEGLTWDVLLGMSLDAIAGMRYLSQRKIVHRDLALRNLLVRVDETDGYVVKVSDFGLSRFTENVYGSSDGLMPIKWAAPEVLRYNNYSTKSDIWAMGVTLWELFSLGQIPYRNLPNTDVIEYVLSGKRLPCPDQCPTEIYEVMQMCWETEPQDRPSWEEVHTRLENSKSSFFKLKKPVPKSASKDIYADAVYGNNPQSG